VNSAFNGVFAIWECTDKIFMDIPSYMEYVKKDGFKLIRKPHDVKVNLSMTCQISNVDEFLMNLDSIIIYPNTNLNEFWNNAVQKFSSRMEEINGFMGVKSFRIKIADFLAATPF
jgi:hypothetical protein